MSNIDFQYIDNVKKRGQAAYEQRLMADESKVSSGSGSNFGGVLKQSLKPAKARFKQSNENNSSH